ncbi:TonB-dependent receptor [Neiella sp. HB171785]|uniref:TonB-dependent receptor n=1 Tax=Neiella litorisoli TaxID=2771431 RepID=A0A8J6QNU5_9GAMM|nr:TonB-dependent receptor [Neiella litorisoli]MBD1388084.1 TonB-dependent receptor [Neiella litorisoli]
MRQSAFGPAVAVACGCFTITSAQSAQPDHIEVIGHQQFNDVVAELTSSYQSPDPGELLKTLPGANINRNGPLTPIAQYRGLYGDRVAVIVDGLGVIGTGPNAMDTPLSYVPMILLDSVELHRGIAPVSSAIESLGGAYQIHLRPMPSVLTDTFQSDATMQLGYRDNGDVAQAAVVAETGNRDHAVQAFFDWRRASDDTEAGNGKAIEPTDYDKWVAGIKYQHNFNRGHWQVWAQRFDTQDAGTPALPMDILYIETDRFGFSGSVDWHHWQTELQLSYSDGEHLMDNFSMRDNGPMTSRMRQNLANSDDLQWSLTTRQRSQQQTIELGFDGLRANHDATITDPTNPMFKIANFNAITDDKTSVYGSWIQALRDSALSWQAGLRLSYIEADAGVVEHSMAAMNPMIAQLVERFNGADRQQEDWLVDATVSVNWQQSSHWSHSLALGHKQRAPSYQERYLWFPLEATAGLADGRSYIGDPNLNAESAWQLDVASRWQSPAFSIEPHLFYQRIDDYIQGTPLPEDNTYMAANKVATMMSGKPPLLFANLEAELYGADLALNWLITDRLQWSSTISYVRGKRRDLNDNLYRVAPPNWRQQLSYQWQQWQLSADWQLVAEQDKVSATNSEQTTGGYGLVALAISRELDFGGERAGSIHLGVDNLFDKAYADHLGGYNRVMAAEQPVGERLNAAGRAIWAKVEVTM